MTKAKEKAKHKRQLARKKKEYEQFLQDYMDSLSEYSKGPLVKPRYEYENNSSDTDLVSAFLADFPYN